MSASGQLIRWVARGGDPFKVYSESSRYRHSMPCCGEDLYVVASRCASAEGGGDDSGDDSIDGGGGGGRRRNDSAAHSGEGGVAPEQIELTPALACSSIIKAGFGFSGQAQTMQKIASTLEHSEARELQRSAMLARDCASIRGCAPNSHCSQTPFMPARPGGHTSHPDRSLFGWCPLSHSSQSIRSDV